MTKILLIGSTGNLGKHVLRKLVNQKSFQVGIMLRKTPEKDSQTNADSCKDVAIFNGDILEKDSMTSGIKWAEIVINCSGKVSYRRKDKRDVFRVNFDGTKNITELCEQFNKSLIHTSSVTVYGYSKNPINSIESNVDRERIYKTKSAYYISKYESEKVVINANIPKIILRPSSLVHDGESTYKKFKKVLFKGIYPDLKGGASFVNVDDVAEVYIKAIGQLLSGKTSEYIFNLGGHNLLFKEVSDSIKVKHNLKCIKIPQAVLLTIGVLNDYFLEPIFNKSPLPLESIKISTRYSYVNSEKSKKILNYTANPLEIQL